MAAENNEVTKKWVKFEEESAEEPAASSESVPIKTEFTVVELEKENNVKIAAPVPVAAPAVITPESVHVTIPRSKPVIPDPLTTQNNKNAAKSTTLRSVDLNDGANGRVGHQTQFGNAVLRQGFANGETIVTLLPTNSDWPWITPAKFRPELVPEELMAQGLTLTVEDYVHIMELLTNDVRFSLYNVCYKRILVVWIFTAFVVLLGLLFSGVNGLTLFGLGVMWLILNAAAIFLCMWIKIKLNHNLEKCLGQINKHLIKHKIILGLDDRGKISCHKVNLCFIYFDSSDCIKKLQEVIEREERENGGRDLSVEERRQRNNFHERMDIDDGDIIIQGSNTSRVSRKQARAEMLLLRYSARWVKLFVRRLLELNIDSRNRSIPVSPPRHCAAARCPCQFIEDHLKYKPKGPWWLYCGQGFDDPRGSNYPFLP